MFEDNDKSSENTVFSDTFGESSDKSDNPWRDKDGKPSVIIGIIAGIIIIMIAYSMLSFSGKKLHNPSEKPKITQEDIDNSFLQSRGRSVEDSKKKAGFFYSIFCGRMSHPSFCE